MSFFLIFVAVIIVLFLVSFFTKRRFGVLGLALIAGSYMASIWSEDLTPIVADLGVSFTAPPLGSIVAAVITLIPALFLLLSGPSYKTVLSRCVGAFLFSLLATLLLLEPLGAALVIDEVAKPVYELLLQYNTMIISACIIIAVLDIFLQKTPKIPKKH